MKSLLILLLAIAVPQRYIPEPADLVPSDPTMQIDLANGCRIRHIAALTLLMSGDTVLVVGAQMPPCAPDTIFTNDFEP